MSVNLTHYEEMLLSEYLDEQPESEREEKKEKALKRLSMGEPIGYIAGKQYFYDLCFKVNENVLIPRPDTERLVEIAISSIKKSGKFIDLGTGSGCISITILSKRPDLVATAVDISDAALDVARENAALYSVCDRISFLQLDMLNDEPPADVFDAVISNPPYIQTKVIAEYPSLSFEPIAALDGGEDGMLFYRAIFDKYEKKLSGDGFFLFEIGFDQKEDIEKEAALRGFSSKIIKDYSGNDRVAIIKRSK